MRISFSIIWIVVTTSILQSQEFAPIGATWYFHEGFAAMPDTGYIELRSAKDTLISGQKCKMIVANKYLECGSRSRVEYMYMNDSNEVFFFDSELDKFQKLWDFNAKENGTWTIQIGPKEFVDSIITYTVDSISEIFINGKELKEFFIHYKFYGGWEFFRLNTIIIESIGDINYFFPWNLGVCDMNYADGLRCYSDSIIGFYSTHIIEPCDYSTLKTNTIKNSVDAISIFPNPTHGQFRITGNTKSISSISICNLQGKILHHWDYSSNPNLDLTNLENGVYITIVRYSEDKVVYTKLIKY